jgi:hypothetical protein
MWEEHNNGCKICYLFIRRGYKPRGLENRRARDILGHKGVAEEWVKNLPELIS